MAFAASVKSVKTADTSVIRDFVEEIMFEELTDVEINQLCIPFDDLDGQMQPTSPDIAEKSRDAQMSSSVDQFISSQQKINTKQCTERDMKNVQRWLYDNKREPRLIEHIIAPHLNSFLAELFIGIRKSDGSNYEPASLESLKNSIERYLKEKNYPVSLRDRVFSQSMRALTAKKMELKKMGMGNKPNKCTNVSKVEEEQMYKSGALGSSFPRSLQFTVFYNFGTMFGLRGRDEARQLKFGDITKKTTSSGQKFLEFNERSTKTRDGANLGNTRETTPKIFASENSDNTRDPIHIFDSYSRRRPPTMMSADSPFYLTPIPEHRLKGTPDESWYYPRAMGEVSLGSLMKNAAKEAGITTRLTNHSIRKTTVTNLSKAGVPPHKIMKITGHKNIQSITHYDAELSQEEHQTISRVLQPSRPNPPQQTISPPTPASSACSLNGANTVLQNVTNQMSHSESLADATTESSSRFPFPSTFLTGNTFHGCTFHLGNFNNPGQ